MSKKVVRGRGRPMKFSPVQAKRVAAILLKNGLTAGQVVLATEGVQMVSGKPKEPMTVSIPTLQKIAAAHNIEFTRGRPFKAA